MKFTILNIEVNLKRKRRANRLDLNGLKLINDDSLNYIKSLSSEELTRRNDLVSFPDLNDKKMIKNKLKDSGIVIIKDFVSSEKINKIVSVINKLNFNIESFLSSNELSFENDDILFQLGSAKLKGYSSLANYQKTVVTVRQGQDEGMIDIFNIDYAFKELKEELRSCYDNSNILNVISLDNESLKFKNLNFYINNEVSSTRGFHADSFDKQLKAFIYLSDCLSLDDGPYTYVEGSHKDSPYRAANKAISEYLPNGTECPLVDHQKIIPVLGRAGSLVISDQSGFHRGFPQSKGHNRVVSVMNVTSQ